MRPARLAGALTLLLLVGCASAPTSPDVRPDAAKAAGFKAAIDGAQAELRATVPDAAEAMARGTITAEAHQRVRTAARRLENAIPVASAEQKGYLRTGVETPDHVAAFAELRAARENLRLVWAAVRP